MDLRLYLHPKTKKDGTVARRWYYYFHNQQGKKVQKACPGCATKEEAEAFIRTIPLSETASAKRTDVIQEIAKNMYLEDSEQIRVLLLMRGEPNGEFPAELPSLSF